MIDTFRDPRTDPIKGDVVEIDFGDGDYEKRTVIGIERHVVSTFVAFRLEDGSVRTTKLSAWRENANDSTVIVRGSK